MFRKLLILVICVTGFLPICSMSAFAGRYVPYRDNVQVRYRNAGDRILTQTADRVIDKIFGPATPRKNRSFTANVNSSIDSTSPYPFLSLGNLVIKIPKPTDVRVDVFNKEDLVYDGITSGLSSYGVRCIPEREVRKHVIENAITMHVSQEDLEGYAEAYCLEHYPVDLIIQIEEFNGHSVVMNASMYDRRQKMTVMGYRGNVVANDMTPPERENALKAIIQNFVGRYGSL